jgi:hypothetical protein
MVCFVAVNENLVGNNISLSRSMCSVARSRPGFGRTVLSEQSLPLKSASNPDTKKSFFPDSSGLLYTDIYMPIRETEEIAATNKFT